MNTTKITRNLFIGFLSVLPWLPSTSLAVAYCSLRDPVGSIQAFYPEYSSYRSTLGVVGPDVRDMLSATLPYPTHFSEFGKHTLYVVYNGEQVLGLVHARTEKGDWGLDELVWSLGMDMTVQDFKFQRSRSRWRSEFENSNFKSHLKGKGVDELRGLLSDDGMTLANSFPGFPTAAEEQAVRIIHSAMKTILVTEHVWSQQLHGIDPLVLSLD